MKYSFFYLCFFNLFCLTSSGKISKDKLKHKNQIDFIAKINIFTESLPFLLKIKFEKYKKILEDSGYTKEEIFQTLQLSFNDLKKQILKINNFVPILKEKKLINLSKIEKYYFGLWILTSLLYDEFDNIFFLPLDEYLLKIYEQNEILSEDFEKIISNIASASYYEDEFENEDQEIEFENNSLDFNSFYSQGIKRLISLKNTYIKIYPSVYTYKNWEEYSDYKEFISKKTVIFDYTKLHEFEI